MVTYVKCIVKDDRFLSPFHIDSVEDINVHDVMLHPRYVNLLNL